MHSVQESNRSTKSVQVEIPASQDKHHKKKKGANLEVAIGPDACAHIRKAAKAYFATSLQTTARRELREQEVNWGGFIDQMASRHGYAAVNAVLCEFIQQRFERPEAALAPVKASILRRAPTRLDALNPRYMTKPEGAKPVGAAKTKPTSGLVVPAKIAEHVALAHTIIPQPANIIYRAPTAPAPMAPAEQVGLSITIARKVVFAGSPQEIEFDKNESPIMCATGAAPHAIPGKGILKKSQVPTADDLRHVTTTRKRYHTAAVKNAAL